MPQLSAVYYARKMLNSVNAKCEIIADGGIRSPGDANKYLAAGATGVMMGNAFSRTKESAGWIVKEEKLDLSKTLRFPLTRPTSLIKRYRGQASASFQEDAFGKSNACPEGAVGNYFAPTGTCNDVVEMYKGGLSSAISYLGLKSSADMSPENVTFIKLTQNSYLEGMPHGCS